LLETSLWILQDSQHALSYGYGPVTNLKKHHLGGQNSFESLGPENMLKIVNVAIINETDETN